MNYGPTLTYGLALSPGSTLSRALPRAIPTMVHERYSLEAQMVFPDFPAKVSSCLSGDFILRWLSCLTLSQLLQTRMKVKISSYYKACH